MSSRRVPADLNRCGERVDGMPLHQQPQDLELAPREVEQ